MSAAIKPEEKTPSPAVAHGHDHAEWSALDADALDELNRSRTSRKFEPGDVVFYQGAPSLGLFCIDVGDVMVRKSDPDGRSVIVRLAREGQTLGYRAFFERRTYAATATAITPCEICFIEAETVRSLMNRVPALADRFLRRTAAELRKAEEERLAAAFRPIRMRVARLLLSLRERFATVDDAGDLLLDLPLSRQDMAALLGARRESIARALTSLSNDGILELNGRSVRIPDLDPLLDEAEPPTRES